MHFSEQERRAIYEVINRRRDVRSEFRPDPVPDEVLERILAAGRSGLAHHYDRW